MCISSLKEMTPTTVKSVIDAVVKVLNGKKFKLKNKKTRILSASNPENLMEITGLWLNRGHPRVRRADRAEIRSELYRCEQQFKISRTDPAYHCEHNSLSGRVAKLSYLQHIEAKEYRERLRKILPHYDVINITKTLKLVSVIERTSELDRGKLSFVERYHQIIYRINIISRSNPSLARTLKSRMHICKPTSTREILTYGE